MNGEAMTTLKSLCLGFAALALSQISIAGNVEAMAEDLITLRGEVEELQAQLDLSKDEHKNRMGSLAVQRADMEAQMSRNGLEIKQLKTSLSDAKEKAAEDAVEGEALKPMVNAAIERLAVYVENGLPFKKEERKASLQEIKSQMDSGILPPHKAINRVWSFYDDEIRLTKESGIYRQPIPLEGEQVLSDVVRVGMMLMYFKTSAEEYGKVVKTDAGWTFNKVEAESEQDLIAAVFDSLKKQIRTGHFQLPTTAAQ